MRELSLVDCCVPSRIHFFLIVLCFNIRNNLFEKAETGNEFCLLINVKNMRKSLRGAMPCTAKICEWRLLSEKTLKSVKSCKYKNSSLCLGAKRRKYGASCKIKSAGHLPVDLNTEIFQFEFVMLFSHFTILYYSLLY